jgi:hypothetical protein
MTATTTEPRETLGLYSDHEINLLRDGAQLFLDWHSLSTKAFVAKYGHGVTLRDIGDKFRAALHPEQVTP